MRAGFGGVLGPLEGVRDNKGNSVPDVTLLASRGSEEFSPPRMRLVLHFVIEERTACRDVDGSRTSQMMRISAVSIERGKKHVGGVLEQSSCRYRW